MRLTFPDLTDISHAAAAHLVSLIAAQKDVFHLALAGGQTPIIFYQILRTMPLPWEKIHIWFSDERAVPPDHLRSNLRMARAALLDHIAIPPAHIHPISAQLAGIRAGAQQYSHWLNSSLPHYSGWPCLDLILLGVGTDGHCASLFPGSCVLHEIHQPAAAVYAPGPQEWRITLTLPTLNHARQIWFLVAGREKAPIIAKIFSPHPGDVQLPVQLLKPHGIINWYLDNAAAQLL